MAILYVSTTGSDSNSGTSGSPVKSINKAAQLAQAGDTVLVGAGTYNGTVSISQQRATGTVTYTTPGAFPNGPVRVIFQDDTYDADKHGGTGLYTWHWDNITIS